MQDLRVLSPLRETNKHHFRIWESGWTNHETSIREGIRELPSYTEANPREHLKAITFRSDKQVEMKKETNPSEEKEPMVKDHGELVQEEGSTLNLQKSVPHPVKEYTPRLPYPSI